MEHAKPNTLLGFLSGILSTFLLLGLLIIAVRIEHAPWALFALWMVVGLMLGRRLPSLKRPFLSGAFATCFLVLCILAVTVGNVD